ncbi:hypothetical protein [Enterobacter kobei]|uniref:hypothetical protein n=1 Tax=Enterobacter kobei TaxID=208224 RepID=UPI0035248165
MTANKPMTGEQLDEMMAVAVNMQRDSEKAGDRPSAMFAYAVQVAVLELRKVRFDASALASLEAEPVAFRSKLKHPSAIGSEHWDYADHRQPDAFELENCIIERLYTASPAQANAEPLAWLWSHRKHPSEVSLVRPEDDERAEGAHWSGWSCQALYAAPPAPVSVPDEDLLHMAASAIEDLLSNKDRSGAGVWADVPAKLRRAAMLKHSEPFIVTSDHRMMEMPQVEAINAVTAMLQGADGKPELTVWYGAMPESNGKANWTAILHRKGEGRCMNGFTIDRSEYPGRVLYAADRVRYLIGEKIERPSILDYDADAHSGYVKPGNSPVIPDGWVMVPEEPTHEMLEAGDEQFGTYDVYRRMIAASPQQEVKP